MSRRTKLKLKNVQMFLRKDIFSGRYIIRNLLAVTIILTMIATVAGIVSLAGAGDDKGKEKTEETAEYSIEYVAGVEMNADSIRIVRAGMEADSEPNVQPNQTEIVAGATGEFDSKFVCVEDNVNVREMATTDSAIVGRLNAGSVGDILSSDGEWLNIKSGQVTGYVKAEFVLTGDLAKEYAKDYQTWTGTMTESGVYIRKDASTEADILDTAYIGSVYPVDYEITSTLEDWVCILMEDQTKGYIYADYISVESSYPSAVLQEEESEETGSDSEKTENVKSDNTPNGSVTENKKGDNNSSDKQPQQTAAEENNSGNEVTPAMTARGAISLSEADINLMATVLTLECGGEPYEGQLAVANLIINRIQSGKWGSTVSDVVYAPNQFSVVTSPKMDYYLQNGAQASCVQAVREACAGNNNIGNYLSFRPLYNANTSSYSSYTIIGNHVFF